jgi:hypothetical protein
VKIDATLMQHWQMQELSLGLPLKPGKEKAKKGVA